MGDFSICFSEHLTGHPNKWKVLKRKKPPKWWLISSYKIVLQVWSGGLFTEQEINIVDYQIVRC